MEGAKVLSKKKILVSFISLKALFVRFLQVSTRMICSRDTYNFCVEFLLFSRHRCFVKKQEQSVRFAKMSECNKRAIFRLASECLSRRKEIKEKENSEKERKQRERERETS